MPNEINPNQLGKQNLTQSDLETATSVRCEKCKSAVWSQGFVMKKTSALSSVGEQVLQIPVIYCVMCGTPLKESCPIPI